jgi:hypothetical protein
MCIVGNVVAHCVAGLLLIANVRGVAQDTRPNIIVQDVVLILKGLHRISTALQSALKSLPSISSHSHIVKLSQENPPIVLIRGSRITCDRILSSRMLTSLTSKKKVRIEI